MTKMMTSYIIEQKLLSGELTEDEQVRMNELHGAVVAVQNHVCMCL